MPKGFSLHIGVSHFDSSHYSGITGKLKGAHNDALLMGALAEANGFNATYLLSPLPHELGSGAYSHELIAALERLATKTEAGDMVLLTFSGHGGLAPDTDDLDISEGKYDATWCLYDRQVLASEIQQLLSRFKPKVRILIIADCCHCFGVTPQNAYLPKALQPEIALRTYFDNRSLYQDIRHQVRNQETNLQASVIQISACQDNEATGDDSPNSLFTRILDKVWENGEFSGNYRDFHRKLRAEATLYGLSPQMLSLSNNPQAKFLQQRPFSVG